MHFDSLPSFQPGDEETLEIKLWTNLAEAGLLVAPGWYFAANDDILDTGSGHFRVSFSFADVRPCLIAIESYLISGLVTACHYEEGRFYFRQGREGFLPT